MSETMHFILEVAMCVFAICMLLAFSRAVKGPRYTDRLVAINMIGTMTTAVICILAVYLNESALIDVSLVYTLLSLWIVTVATLAVQLR